MYRMVRAISLIALAAFFTSAITAAASPVTPQEQKLIRAAKKEGAVTLLNPLFSDGTAANMGPAFIKRYNLGSDFKFQNVRKRTGDVVGTARAEMKAGKYSFDTFVVINPGFFAAATKRGYFAKLDSGQWKYHVKAVERAGQYHHYPEVPVVLAYTFQPVWNTACPGMKNVKVASYWDTVKPEFKGRTIVSRIPVSTSYTLTTLSMQESGFDLFGFWKKLKATDPVVEARTEPKMQMLITCERGMDMWNMAGRVFQNVKKKPALAKVLRVGAYKEGQVMLGNQAAVPKGAPHPNAGKLFLDFLLSKEGADVFVGGEAVYTFREGYTPPEHVKPYLLDLSKTKLLGLKDWIGASKKVKGIRGKWKNQFK